MLKAHVFFWLSEPADNLHIKAVLKQHAPGVDLAPFKCTTALHRCTRNRRRP
jgi:hypothetical protein